MRRILVDHARSHQYAKRGGGARKVSLDGGIVVAQEQAADLIALDDALRRLTALMEDCPEAEVGVIRTACIT